MVGADSNAHSHLWGPDQNARGDAFEDLISQNDLTILNDGLEPTLSQGGEQEIMDRYNHNKPFCLGKVLWSELDGTGGGDLLGPQDDHF